MKRGILSLITWSIPFLLPAQNNTTNQSILTKAGTGATEGIQWTTGLSWKQIKQKAKAENKYIFIDAYTTWCGPCKMMDKQVYINDTVGGLFNDKFISVKVQMDQTKNDNDQIKSWYLDATAIKKQYHVEAYPSFIFLSPSDQIVHMDVGLKRVSEFIQLAETALTPGKVYDDPYLKYQNLVNEYGQGIKHYDRMAEMIKIAFKLGDGDFARELLKDHVNYASTLTKKERYTQENIKVWSSFALKLDSKALGFFLKDGNEIDKVMNQKGYAIDVVDNTIQARIVDSFFRMQKGETTTITGKKIPNSEIMFVNLPVRMDGKIEPDLVEADWKTLKTMISQHFGKDYTMRNHLKAKVRWYQQHQNQASLSRVYFTQLLDKYPPADLRRESESINEYAWETFLYVTDKKLLNKALFWLGKVIQDRPEVNHLDTYANLLYKLGHTEDAIKWEEKAIALNKTYRESPYTLEWKSDFQLALEQMKKGEQTYVGKGAMWPKEK